MAITITLPELGEGVDSVDVVAVLISVGDTVEVDQGLIEVETEKASVEVPSTAAGTVTEIHVAEGDVLGENALIVTLDVADGEDAAAAEETTPVVEPAEEKRGKGAEEMTFPPLFSFSPPPLRHSTLGASIQVSPRSLASRTRPGPVNTARSRG
jgi:pyruvate dehydrogenase E2 component (dihydrolipoamide acetyltransferase)